MAFSKQQIMRLWVQAGGDPAKAGEAAAVALAESSGRPGAVNRNTNGSIDRGLWQINSIHGGKSTFDPLANARAAVAISGNGRSFRPWVAFNTGAYRKFLGGGGARGASQAPSGPSRGRPGGRATTTTVGAVDNSRARGQAIASFLLNKSDTPLDLAVQLKSLADVPGQKVTVRPRQRTEVTTSAGGRTPAGVADFEGHKVAAWLAPALRYGRQHGWKGTVTSGLRSFADQQRIYNSGVRPAAKPGTSNHEGTQFPRGAVDVSDASTLARILRNSPYRNRLVYAGRKDPVHFSRPHNGGY